MPGVRTQALWWGEADTLGQETTRLTGELAPEKEFLAHGPLSQSGQRSRTTPAGRCDAGPHGRDGEAKRTHRLLYRSGDQHGVGPAGLPGSARRLADRRDPAYRQHQIRRCLEVAVL